ncbi:unnamed protein product [Arctogadus glacialis]
MGLMAPLKHESHQTQGFTPLTRRGVAGGARAGGLIISIRHAGGGAGSTQKGRLRRGQYSRPAVSVNSSPLDPHCLYLVELASPSHRGMIRA